MRVDAYPCLAAAYALVSIVCASQFVRISRRVPGVGLTTQKVFHLAHGFTALARAASFVRRRALERRSIPRWARAVTFDGPGLIFLSAYATVILFWAEIYHGSRRGGRGEGVTRVKRAFLWLNVSAYVIEIGIWIALAMPASRGRGDALERASTWTLAAASAASAAGFATYGGRLFVMLRRFPVDLGASRARKLREIGTVTVACATAFTARCAMLAASARSTRFAVDVYASKTLNVSYYVAVEILPSVLVLWSLRRLPPKRRGANDGDDGDDGDDARRPLVLDGDDSDEDDPFDREDTDDDDDDENDNDAI